ncbi:MAG: S9 family peptidase [Pseudomonadota bacterium]
MRLAICLTAAFSLSLSAAHADTRPMEIADLLKVRHVSGLAVSPDGSSVAYGLTKMRDILAGEDNGSADRHLYLATAQNETRAFVIGSLRVSSIAFDPAGKHITFLAKMPTDSHTALYEIPVDGGNQRVLYSHSASIYGYAWAPDGKTVYFTASSAEDADEKALRKKGFNARIYEEGRKANTLWRLDVSSREPRAEQLKIDGHPTSLDVSPDGKTIAVAIAPTPHIDDDLMKRRFHILSGKSGKVRQVVETPGKVGAFQFSPDGKAFALIAGVDKHDPAATTLYGGRIGKDDLSILRTGNFAVADIDWMTNGQIAALIHEGEGSRIELLSADGNVLVTKPQAGHVAHDIDSANNVIAASMSAPSHPRALFVTAGDTMIRWTDHNEWTKAISFAESDSYTYTARDGQSISGVLTQPLKRKRNRRVPLIMMVHGGPEAHDSNGWNTSYGDPVQIAAGKGYATFQPNYRGSTGRGTAFSKQHQNDYAGKEFNDLVDGIKALVDDGLVDEKRVGITGGSYGGYASAWAATKLTEHFAASVMFVGISNQISKFGTTDIPNEMYLVHSRAWPWEDWQNMIDVSPVTYAGQSKTPTLILHGEDDTRVHPSQSYEMYRNLKLRSAAPVRFVTYPGEGHGNSKASARIDYAHRLLRWMDHFLIEQEKTLPPMKLDALAQQVLNGKKE